VSAGLTALLLPAVVVLATTTAAGSEEVKFQSDGHVLHGCITRPDGRGPFPVVIYNHGSEKNPSRCGPPELAQAYVGRGYLFFSFHRHGHGQSPGDYILDLQQGIAAEVREPAARQQQIVALQDSYNRDVVGAVAWLLKQPGIDRKRVAMTGVSYGGIQTLLTAEQGLGLRAFVAFAPGAMSWRNMALQERLVRAVRDAKAPLFLAQAQNDFSLGPSEMLGPIVRAKGPPSDAKVYPAFGTTPQDGHGAFAVRAAAIAVWGPDVFNFLDNAMKR
jgi:carboxymethylenebutenolidase